MTLPDNFSKPRCKAFDDGYDRQRRSKKQEIRIAKDVGGQRQSGSGNRGIVGSFKASSRKPVLLRNPARGGFGRASVSQGDVKQDDFLIEAKRTDAKSIRIEDDWLLKIDAQAAALGKMPALAIEIGGMSNLTEKDWFLVPKSVFHRFQKLLKGDA